MPAMDTASTVREVDMRPRVLRSVTALTLAISLIVLSLSGAARAEQSYALHGLFCNTEGQIDETLARMRSNLSPQAAVALTNQKTVVCVYADKIKYVVIHPIIIRKMLVESQLTKYEATITGVLVGGAMRPVEPPVQIFFVTPESVPGATVLGKV